MTARRVEENAGRLRHTFRGLDDGKLRLLADLPTRLPG